MFGNPTIAVGEEVIAQFRSHRVPALIGYLAAKAIPCRREEIAEVLWPEREEGKGRHNLRQTILYARAVLGSNAFTGGRDTLGLNPAFSIDVIEFEALADSANIEDLARAAELYKGPFLDGFFDDWVENVRLQLLHKFVEVQVKLSEKVLDGSPEQALANASVAINSDPFNERARALKIRALRKLGMDAAARHELRSFSDYLLAELAMKPSRIVQDALLDSIAVTEPTGHPAQVDLAGVVDSLARGRQPSEGVELALTLIPHWKSVGASKEGLEILENAVGVAGLPASSALHLRVQIGSACLLLDIGELDSARDILDNVLPALLDPVARVRANILRGSIELFRYRPSLSRPFTQRAIEEARQLGMVEEELEASAQVGRAAFVNHDYDTAIEYLTEAHRLAEERSNAEFGGEVALFLSLCLVRTGRRDEARLLTLQAELRMQSLTSLRAVHIRVGLARALEEIGDRAGAEERYRKGCAQYESRESPLFLAVCLTYLGDHLELEGDSTAALECHHIALESRRFLNDELGTATSLRGIGRSLRSLGQLDEARKSIAESARLYFGVDAILGYASSLCVLGIVESERGNNRLAERILSRALTLIQNFPPAAAIEIGTSGPALVAEAQSLLDQLRENSANS